MTDCKNTNSEEEELSQTQNSETDLDFKEDQALVSGPGNALFFDISQKNLKEFPTYLYEKCLYVKHLYLESNLLQELSNCFFPSLPCLQWLDVRNNILRNLPKSIANHCNLEVLLLQGNQIQALPLELGTVPKLRGIQLLGNPITFPPHKVLKQGIQSIIAFLQEEYKIQAPSPSTIRPIAEPFYKCVELRDGLLSQKFRPTSGLVKQRRKSTALHKKRVTSSNLPVITVKSYQKLGLEPGPAWPKTCVPQYKLSDTPLPEQVILNDREDLPNLSNRIQSVGNKTLQSQSQDAALNTERSRSEAKIQMNLLKEMFVRRIKEMLEKQAAIIQRTKDKEMLRNWRQDRPQRNCKQEPGELPYDTDPNYMTMPSTVKLQNPKMARKRQNKEAQTKALKNIGEEMSDIFKSLQELDNSRKDTGLSPQTEKITLNNEIQMLEQIQKKLQVLHFRNAHQNIAIPSLPVRGQHIHVEGRKNFSQL